MTYRGYTIERIDRRWLVSIGRMSFTCLANAKLFIDKWIAKK